MKEQDIRGPYEFLPTGHVDVSFQGKKTIAAHHCCTHPFCNKQPTNFAQRAEPLDQKNAHMPRQTASGSEPRATPVDTQEAHGARTRGGDPAEVATGRSRYRLCNMPSNALTHKAKLRSCYDIAPGPGALGYDVCTTLSPRELELRHSLRLRGGSEQRLARKLPGAPPSLPSTPATPATTKNKYVSADMRTTIERWISDSAACLVPCPAVFSSPVGMAQGVSLGVEEESHQEDQDGRESPRIMPACGSPLSSSDTNAKWASFVRSHYAKQLQRRYDVLFKRQRPTDRRYDVLFKRQLPTDRAHDFDVS